MPPGIDHYIRGREHIPALSADELVSRAAYAELVLAEAGLDRLVGQLRQGVRVGSMRADGRVLWTRTVIAAERAAVDQAGAVACSECARLINADAPLTDEALDCGGRCPACAGLTEALAASLRQP